MGNIISLYLIQARYRAARKVVGCLWWRVVVRRRAVSSAVAKAVVVLVVVVQQRGGEAGVPRQCTGAVC